jgi:hypothetical protein
VQLSKVAIFDFKTERITKIVQLDYYIFNIIYLLNNWVGVGVGI